MRTLENNCFVSMFKLHWKTRQKNIRLLVCEACRMLCAVIHSTQKESHTGSVYSQINVQSTDTTAV